MYVAQFRQILKKNLKIFNFLLNSSEYLSVLLFVLNKKKFEVLLILHFGISRITWPRPWSWKISDTAIHLIKRLNDLSDGLITGKKIQEKLKQYLNLDVSESNHGTARNEKFTVTRQERNFHCINIVLKKFH